MKEKHLTKINFFSPLISLIFIGIVFLSFSSISEASYVTGDKFYFLKKQLIWLAIALLAFFISSKIKLSFIKKYSVIGYILSLLLLAIVLFTNLGSQALGAKRWLNLGFVGLQPSEFAKILIIIFFSKIFSNTSTNNLKYLIIYLIAPITLIILEPNFSTAILICSIIITMYYTAGGEIVSLFILCSVIILASAILIFTSPYRLSRLSSSYHSQQMILTLSSGHILGKGFANSDQKYRFLPKISTDSILAIIGEETGFMGLCFIIYLYLSLTSKLFIIAKQISDKFLSLITTGVACWIAFQSLINISVNISLIPLTGIPLPFISYGGSSLIILMFSLGLIQNIQNSNLKLLYSKNNDEKIKNNYNHRHPSHSSH